MTQLRHWLRNFGAMQHVKRVAIPAYKCATGYKLANDVHDTRALQHYMGQEYHAHGSIHRHGA